MKPQHKATTDLSSIVMEAFVLYPPRSPNHLKYFRSSENAIRRRRLQIRSRVLRKGETKTKEYRATVSIIAALESRLKMKFSTVRHGSNSRVQVHHSQSTSVSIAPSSPIDIAAQWTTSRGDYSPLRTVSLKATCSKVSECDPPSPNLPQKDYISNDACGEGLNHVIPEILPDVLAARAPTSASPDLSTLLAPSMTRRRLASNRPALQHRLSFGFYSEVSPLSSVSPGLAFRSPAPVTPADQFIQLLHSPPALPRLSQGKPQPPCDEYSDGLGSPQISSRQASSPCPAVSPLSPLDGRTARLTSTVSPGSCRGSVRRRLSYSRATPQSRSVLRSPCSSRLIPGAYLASPLHIPSSSHSPLTPTTCNPSNPLSPNNLQYRWVCS